MSAGLRAALALLVTAVLGCGAGSSTPARARDAAPGDSSGPAVIAGADDACEAELSFFEREVNGPILAVRCVGCHNADGVAAETRMVLRHGADALSHNYDALAAVVEAELQGTPLLLLRPTGLHPDGHTGGALAPPGSLHHAALSGFVAQIQTAECDAPPVGLASCEQDAPGGPQLRRLSHAEYESSVEDLLGIDSHAASRFAADTVVHGFDNNAGALQVTPLLADQLAAEAERLATLAVADLGALLPCVPEQGDACAEQFLRELGRRAFRRPMTDDELARYLELHRLGAAEGGFADGMQLALSTLLQSPNFLYRTEIGDGSAGGGARIALTDYEIATQIAYALTGSAPDEALLEAAAAGELVEAEARRAQAERLLQTARGREQLVRFVAKWLELERLASVPKDAELFPDFDQGIREAMEREVAAFVDDVVFGAEASGELGELLTAGHTFVDATLAEFYGLPAVAEDATERVDAPDPQRAGLLTLGAVMATHARPDGSSPVHRGKLIRERVLCQPLPLPPPGVVVEPPPVDPTLSVRERYDAHSQKEPCKSCHRLIDPIGLSLEHFDGVGRYREREGDHAIDASGEIVQSGATDARFDGAVELAQALAASPEVRDCFALQWFRFAHGVSEDAELACTVEQLRGRFADSGGRIQELLVATVEPSHVIERQPWIEGPGVAMPQADPTAPVTEGEQDEESGGPMGPETVGDVSVSTRTDSSWEAGRCDAVTVTNDGAASTVWQVTLTLEGTMTNHWNATASGSSGEVTFTGVEWNRELAPAASAEFGYCLEL